MAEADVLEAEEVEESEQDAIAAEIEEAVAEQQSIMAEEAELSSGFKERKKAVQSRIDVLTAKRALSGQLAGLSPEARKQVLADLSKEK